MRKKTSLLLALCFAFAQLWAQNRTVTGTVTDEKGMPIPAATVLVKGTKIGTSTKEDGTFSISVPASQRVLIISSIGLASKEITIGSNNTVNTQLAAVDKSMEEVIVVAYGTVKKSEYTGSSVQVSAEDFAKRPMSNVANALVGAGPGIQAAGSTGQPGSAPAIRIRGFGSYSASSAPLYVVDGAVYDANISDLNAEDIESISTLKDAASAALYGARAGNGVILITTKKGKKNTNHLTFKTSQGVTQRGLPEYDRIDAYQYYPVMWEALKNSLVTANIPAADAAKLASGTWPTRFTTGANAGKQNYNGVAYSDISQFLGYNPFNVASTAIVAENGTLNPNAQLKWADDLDWAEAITQGSTRQEYQLTYNGGSDKSDYYGSFGYNDEKGYLINSGFKRFSGRVSVNTQPLSWFKTGFNVAGNVVNNKNGYTDGGSALVNPFYATRYMGPIYPIHAHDATTGAYLLDASGQPYYDYGNSGGASRPVSTGRHPVAENLWNERLVKRNAVSGRTYADLIFTPWLKATTNLSVDVLDYLYQEYDNKIVGDGSPSGRSRRTATKTTSYTFNQLLNFNKRIGMHNISALVGHENYDLNYNYLYGSRQGQLADGITEFENFSTTNSISSQTDKKKIESFLSKVNYDFDGKYLLSGSLRRDGNSLFAKDFRWANFWSVGGGWRLDREKFLQPIKWVNQLKIRSSYGITGNDGGLGYYPYQGLYTLGYNNGTESGIVLGNLANDSLTWETSKAFDLGVDFSLFRNRISGTVEYFNRLTSGLIFSVPQPLSNGGIYSGSLSVNKNIGNMSNKGFEVTLNGDIIRTKDLTWNLGVNWTKFKNEITKMPDGRKEIVDGTKKLSETHSIYSYWLKHFYGVDPTDGAALYTYNTYSATNCRIIDNGKGSKDTVTTDISNAKLMYTGDVSTPDYYGSITNSVRFKNFNLSFLLTYRVGGKIYDGSYASLMSVGSYGTALSTDILSRWQKAGDITNVPRMDNSRTSAFDGASDRWLTSGTSLNVNNISLSYTIPSALLSKAKIQSATVFVNGENLHLFSKRNGMNVNGSFAGTTDNTYNVSRILTAGITVTF